MLFFWLVYLDLEALWVIHRHLNPLFCSFNKHSQNIWCIFVKNKTLKKYFFSWTSHIISYDVRGREAELGPANLPCMTLILFFHLLRNLLNAFLLKHLQGTVLSKYWNYKQMYTASFLKEPIVQLRGRL